MCRIVSEGAASKRLGIDEEREAVPLTLSVAYNKVLFLYTDFLFYKQYTFLFLPLHANLDCVLSDMSTGGHQWEESVDPQRGGLHLD